MDVAKWLDETFPNPHQFLHRLVDAVIANDHAQIEECVDKLYVARVFRRLDKYENALCVLHQLRDQNITSRFMQMYPDIDLHADNDVSMRYACMYEYKCALPGSACNNKYPRCESHLPYVRWFSEHYDDIDTAANDWAIFDRNVSLDVMQWLCTFNPDLPAHVVQRIFVNMFQCIRDVDNLWPAVQWLITDYDVDIYYNNYEVFRTNSNLYLRHLIAVLERASQYHVDQYYLCEPYPSIVTKVPIDGINAIGLREVMDHIDYDEQSDNYYEGLSYLFQFNIIDDWFVYSCHNQAVDLTVLANAIRNRNPVRAKRPTPA